MEGKNGYVVFKLKISTDAAGKKGGGEGGRHSTFHSRLLDRY